MLEFRILGPLEVVSEERPIRLGGPKQRATPAILLLNANRVVSVDRLADDLYSGAAPVTAVTQVQRQISELRKVLGSASAIETRPPGYMLRVLPDALDLYRFERLTLQAGDAFARGEAGPAADLLRRALGCWRGDPLADLAYESFARTAIDRLVEIRMTALEARIEADHELGRHAELVAELEELVAVHPFREGLRRQLMLALYRSGRQAEALELYRATRELLVDAFGIEPSPALRELERAMLAHDRSLDRQRAARAGAVLVLPSRDESVEGLLEIAEPLARFSRRELIVARLLADETDLRRVASALNARRSSLDVPARTAVFTTTAWADDAVRLATTNDVDLVLVDAPVGLDAAPPDPLAAMLDRSPADVVVGGFRVESLPSGIFVPFGGGEHDWAALELAAWIASATAAPLRLVGIKADRRHGQRDASRLLADASLAVQRLVGVDSEPCLAEPTEEGLLAAVEPAGVVVAGISRSWRRDGIGNAGRALVRRARAPTLLVHGGRRPSGLAPGESRTRFNWSLAG